MTELATIERDRVAPWIGVGVKGEWTDYRDALVAAKMDFYVTPQDALTHMDTITGHDLVTVPGIQVNVRPDTSQIMGVVSNNYGIVQNEDAFSMLQPFTDAGGVITNAGYTEQGLMFMVLRMHETTILGDKYDVDIMAVNSFNGAFPCAIIMVPTRIICQNMYRGLMGRGNDNVLRFRHGSKVDERLAAAKHALGTVNNYLAAFENTLENAANKRMDTQDIMQLVALLFPYPKPGGAREMVTRDRVDMYRKEFIDKYYCAPDNQKFQGTGMGFVNAYMDYLSHREPTKNMQGIWADRRLSGLVSGNDVKSGLIKEAV